MNRIGPVAAIALGCALAFGRQAAERTLMGPSGAPDGKLTSSSAEVSTRKGERGTEVTILPGKDDYPGVTLTALGKGWDLSRFGHVEARLTNTGGKPITVSLRVDDDGDWRDSPWNAESLTLAPGASGSLNTIFGYSYGYKPGYRLKSAAVVRLLLFASKSPDPQSFRIESIAASGPAGEKPPVAPEDVRIRPSGGRIVGPGVVLDLGKQLSTKEARATVDAGKIRVAFSTAGGERWVSLRPPTGRWDLREFDGVRIKVRNVGRTKGRPVARIESGGAVGEWQGPARSVPPGAAGEFLVTFAGTKPLDVEAKTGGSQIATDAVSAVTLTSAGSDEAAWAIEEVGAVATPDATPAWLGKRVPAPGEWVKTLDEEFDGTKLNRKVWRAEGENYYDKVSHWSKANVVLGGGVARLRFEKKRGFQNDDPKRNETPYASGYLDTYGLWTQRYGYFEARVKLPAAPGLWPAFWMMPDRGQGEQWQRQDTGNGGMEFDIMENLTRWGTRRYNVAMHYDGYGKEHRALGSDKIYVRPDKAGFVTCGLLWTPGSAVFYCNGREVLRWKNPRISNVPSILMFTLPSGGWDNDALDDEKLPADFVIDYVRVWQRKDLLGAQR